MRVARVRRLGFGVLCGAGLALATGCGSGGGGGGGDTGSGSGTGTVVTEALDDSVVTQQNRAIDIDVLANDVDASGLGLTYAAFTQGAHGTVVANGDSKRTLKYTPARHYNGADEFTYRVLDGDGKEVEATVRVTVEPVTLAVEDSARLLEDGSVEVEVLANDTDGAGGGLSVVAVTPGGHGATTINGGSTVTYAPEADFFGVDSFDYTIEDSAGGRSTGTVTLEVEAVNDAPEVALEIDARRVSRGGSFEVRVTSRDPDDAATIDLYADADGDLATVVDQFTLLAGLIDRDGGTETVRVGIAGIPLGSYRILAEARDLVAPPVVAFTTDTIEFANVALAGAIGGASIDSGNAVATFDDGSWVVAGAFSGRAVLGRGEPAETDLVATGGRDIFVARFDASGALVWAQSAGGTADDVAHGVATLDGGAVALTGSIQGEVVFGLGEPRETRLVASGGKDAFVQVLAGEDGSTRWVRALVGADLTATGDSGSAVAGLPGGGVIVAGSFEEDLTLGSGSVASERTLLSAGRTDVFVARYDRDGFLEWAARAGGAGEDHGASLASFRDGSCAVTGSFFAEADFGTGSPGRRILRAAGVSDVFIARYGADGSFEWATRAGGAAAEAGAGISAFADGTMVVTGDLFGPAVFGEGEAGATTLRPVDGPDLFVARYRADGELEWAVRAGGQVNGRGDRGRAVAALADGSCVVTGSFETDAVFGDGEPGRTTLRTSSASDVFIARFDPDGRLRWVRQAGGDDLGAEGDQGLAIAAFPDGAIVATGTFDALAVFGAGDPGEARLDSGPAPDAFLAVLNADGGF